MKSAAKKDQCIVPESKNTAGHDAKLRKGNE
jgi:hypothetical protein